MLIIEDHRATAELWSDVLVCAGAQAWVAGTIAEATRALDAFDLELQAVILDYSLPDGNGGEILPALAGRCAAPGLVVATGLPPEEASAIAARFRADCLIIKPVTAHDLVRSVAIAVTCKRARDRHARIGGGGSRGGQALRLRLAPPRGRPPGTRVRSSVIREARREHGLSQASLAERAGVTERTVAHAEAGRRVSWATAAAIGSSLGLSLSELVEPGDHPARLVRA